MGDAALDAVKGHATLQGVTLWGPSFTDAGLRSLANCGNLSELRLLETSVTQSGVSALTGRPLGFHYYFDRDE